MNVAQAVIDTARFHHHCGPFNTMADATGPVDAVCKEHDERYTELGPLAYLTHTDADDKFIVAMDQQPGILPTMYSGVFKARKAVLPRWTVPSVEGHPVNQQLTNQTDMPKKSTRQQPNYKALAIPKKQRPRGTPGPPPTRLKTGPIATKQPLNSAVSQRVVAPSAQSFVRYGGPAGEKRRFSGQETVISTITASRVLPIFVNPADDVTFPILSQESRLALRYRYHNLTLTYIPAVATTTAGELGIAWIGDPNLAVPTTFNELLALTNHAVTPVWQGLTMSVPPGKLRGARSNFFVSKTASETPSLHEPGYFVVYTETADPGRILLSYDVELIGRNPYPLTLAAGERSVSWCPLNSAVANLHTNVPGTAADKPILVQTATNVGTKSPYLYWTQGVAGGVNSYVLNYTRPGLYKFEVHLHCDDGGAGNVVVELSSDLIFTPQFAMGTATNLVYSQGILAGGVIRNSVVFHVTVFAAGTQTLLFFNEPATFQWNDFNLVVTPVEID